MTSTINDADALYDALRLELVVAAQNRTAVSELLQEARVFSDSFALLAADISLLAAAISRLVAE